VNPIPLTHPVAEAPLGFAHFLGQTDAVGLSLLGVLVAMSIASWTLIALQTLARWRGRQRSALFLARFWDAPSLDAVRRELDAQGVGEPFGRLTAQALRSREHHARHGATRLAEAGSEQEFLARSIKQGLDEEALRQERGLTLLATVGATAPFVGLFGTVWGVYHALLAIGAGGAGTLDQVAGPVGEALVMTGIGLAVAIPAVIGYNALVRANRVLAGRLDGFAHELLTFLSHGAPIAPAGNAGRAAAPVAAVPQAVAARA
jgi:biopolymer transport protein ExbB